MTLEEQAIAAFRKGLLKANSSQLLQFWAEAITLKGGNESVIFDEMACRDIVAYTIIHFINIRSATIFGGFIRSHFSGKPWHDIDMFSGKRYPNRIHDISSRISLHRSLLSKTSDFLSSALSVTVRCKFQSENHVLDSIMHSIFMD